MKRLTDQQLSEAEERARLSGTPLSQCPTCLAHLVDGEIESKTYKLDGVEHPCDCREQIRLRTAYFYANVPTTYQTLTWEDYEGPEEVKEAVEAYLAKWDSFKSHGIGIAFLSRNLGNGKTMCSLQIGRELIKRGETVFFLPHNQLSRALRYNDENLIEKMNTATVLILDDIQAPPHDKLEQIFADNLEDVVRNRTNYNGVTLLSSNLSLDELKSYYPRVWSVLSPKVMIQRMNGGDARQSFVGERAINRALNEERAPIV